MKRHAFILILPVVAAGMATLALTPLGPRPNFLRESAIAKPGARPIDATAKARYRLTQWRDLAAPGWTAERPFNAQDVASLDDADPRAQQLLARLRSTWGDAPPNAALDGVAIRTAGYVVPLESSREGLREFLLVPYFGACIHTPPPPANQVIDVSTSAPLREVESMDTVWVEGRLAVARTNHDAGASTYVLRADAIESYGGPMQ